MLNGLRWYTTDDTTAAVSVISTSEAKRHLNLDGVSNEDDTYIDGLIQSATIYCLGRMPAVGAFVNRTIDLVLDAFPNGADRLELPVAPFGSITSITYFDTSNSSTTLTSTDYQTRAPRGNIGYIEPAIDKTWPGSKMRDDAVTIKFVAGYGAAGSSVPETIRQAVKLKLTDLYVNRGDGRARINSNIDDAVDNLLMTSAPGWYA